MEGERKEKNRKKNKKNSRIVVDGRTRDRSKIRLPIGRPLHTVAPAESAEVSPYQAGTLARKLPRSSSLLSHLCHARIMAYYGIYGSLRSSGGTSHGLTAQSHKTLPSKSKRSSCNNDRSPGRTTQQYLTPNYSSTWKPRNPSPTRYSADYRTTSSYSRPQSLLAWPHKEQNNSRRSLSPSYGYGSDYGYGLERERSPGRRCPVDYSPQKPASDYSRVKGLSRNTVWTDLSLRYSKTSPRYSGKALGEGYIPTNHHAATRNDYSYPASYESSKKPEMVSWRTRLAQQGYRASTSKQSRVVADRKWHYLDDTESEEPEEDGDFVYRTSRGTRHESDDQHESVISRVRRMKLQKVSEVAQSSDLSIQVDVEELEKHRELEERRAKRTFISSRHHSWYDTGTTSYKKYLSPMPWRGSSNYSSTRYSKGNSPEEGARDAVLSPQQKDTEANKDFRKSVLNMDLPQTEAQLFAKRQAETRWRRTVEDPYCTSEDGSPSETGYDSSYTDADRSSNDTEGFFTDSLDRSYTFGPGSSYRSSPRSTPFGDEAHFVDDGRFLESVCDEPQSADYHEPYTQLLDESEGSPREDATLEDLKGDPNDIENLCFKFKSLNDASSQRDSGFSEVYNQCDSPSSVAPTDSDTCFSEPASQSKFISALTDIDQLLMDKDFDVTAFQTFEDFDRKVDRQKSNVRTRMQCCEEYGLQPSSKWSKPARVGLRLDIESCSRFIGTCHDIDEMLGLPTPLSPDSESTTVRGPAAGFTVVPEGEEGDGISTTATSVIGSSDIADLNWLSDYDQSVEQSARKGWPARHSLTNELDDCTLQLYRYNGTEGDYGNYLDLESTIDEQAEDFEDFHRKCVR